MDKLISNTGTRAARPYTHFQRGLMTERHRIPPVWLMGLGNATLGFSTGIIYFVLPQLLAADHVPEGRIATMTAIAFSPNFWCGWLAKGQSQSGNVEE